MSTHFACILWIRMSTHLEWYTSYLSLKRNPVFLVFDIRCSCQLVNSNIRVGVAARNIEFGDKLT